MLNLYLCLCHAATFASVLTVLWHVRDAWPHARRLEVPCITHSLAVSVTQDSSIIQHASALGSYE
jgi:hypothetical protein